MLIKAYIPILISRHIDQEIYNSKAQETVLFT